MRVLAARCLGREDLEMKCKRHSPEQIIRKLRDADRMLSEGKRPGVFSKLMKYLQKSIRSKRSIVCVT